MAVREYAVDPDASLVHKDIAVVGCYVGRKKKKSSIALSDAFPCAKCLPGKACPLKRGEEGGRGCWCSVVCPGRASKLQRVRPFCLCGILVARACSAILFNTANHFAVADCCTFAATPIAAMLQLPLLLVLVGSFVVQGYSSDSSVDGFASHGK